MKKLRVEVTKFVDETAWDWRLLDEEGAFVADHEVRLSESDSEFEGLVDLPRFLRWRADSPENEGESESLARVGTWIRAEAWGPMMEAILTAADEGAVTVVVEVPAGAESLLYRPFELPFVLDPSRLGLEVSLVYQIDANSQGGRPLKQPVEDRLKMLAIFSTPADQVALNIQFERRELRRMVERLTTTKGRAIELRVLQYGATKALIEETLEEGDGWDLIHFSGHGLPDGLVLETQSGATDLIPSLKFAELLRPTRTRLKLVTLSSCESGAVAAVQALRNLGVSSPAEANAEEDDKLENLPAAAQRLVDHIGCAVLAMRFPVEDEFAVGLAIDVYEGLLEYRQSLPRALQRALNKAARERGRGLSLATPALFGASAANLLLDPPSGEPESFDLSRSKVAYFDPEPEHFVGRVRQLSRATAALAPTSAMRGVMFCGMAGAGKTACALELSYGHQERRFEGMAWHKAPNEGELIDDALVRFAANLELQLEGFELAPVVDDIEKLRAFLPKLIRLMTDRSVLIVLDNAESLLTADGRWRDERWEILVEGLVSHTGLSRFLLTSRIAPINAQRPDVLVETIDSLSASESALLAAQLPNLGQLMASSRETGQAGGKRLVRRALEIVQGHPKLIEFADRAAADPSVLEARIDQVDGAWAHRADLTAFFKTGEADEAIGADDFLEVLEAWTRGVAETLPPTAETIFQLLCCLEVEDRRQSILQFALPTFWKNLELDAPAPEVTDIVEVLANQALVDIEEKAENDAVYRIHPAVEQAERAKVDSEVASLVDRVMARLWITAFEEALKNKEGPILVHSGLHAAPYLLRIDRAESVIEMLGKVKAENPAPSVTGELLPLLRRAHDLASDPSLRRRAKAEILTCYIELGLRGSDVIPELEALLDSCRQEGDLLGLAILRGTLLNELFRRGRLKECRELLDPSRDPELLEEFGDIHRVSDEVHRLQLMQELGENEEVLDAVSDLLERIEEMGGLQAGRLIAERANMREVALSIARTAAKAVRDWESMLSFNAAIRESEKERGAPPIEQAKTDFNDHAALIELERMPEAEQCLRWVRQVAEATGDLQLLGSVFDAWASLARRRERPEEAMEFALRSLRNSYRFGIPQSINVSHHNIANHLQSTGGSPRAIAAHRIAEVLISYQTESGEYRGDLRTLAATLKRLGDEDLPTSFDEVCACLRENAEVDFRYLFGQLPARSADGDAAMSLVIAEARRLLEDQG